MSRSSSWLNDTPLWRTAVNSFTGIEIIPSEVVPLQIDLAVPGLSTGTRARDHQWGGGLALPGECRVGHAGSSRPGSLAVDDIESAPAWANRSRSSIPSTVAGVT